MLCSAFGFRSELGTLSQGSSERDYDLRWEPLAKAKELGSGDKHPFCFFANRMTINSYIVLDVFLLFGLLEL